MPWLALKMLLHRATDLADTHRLDMALGTGLFIRELQAIPLNVTDAFQAVWQLHL